MLKEDMYDQETLNKDMLADRKGEKSRAATFSEMSTYQ